MQLEIKKEIKLFGCFFEAFDANKGTVKLASPDIFANKI
jgi:hypothetical protein